MQVRTIASFLSYDEASRQYVDVQEPTWHTADNDGVFIIARLAAEKVDGVLYAGDREYIFADTEEDKALMETLAIGDKIAIKPRKRS